MEIRIQNNLYLTQTEYWIHHQKKGNNGTGLSMGGGV